MDWQGPSLGTEEALVEFLTQLDVKVKDVSHSDEQTTKNLSLPGESQEGSQTLSTEELIREAKLVVDGEVVEEAPAGVEELTPTVPYDANLQLSRYTAILGEAEWQTEAPQTTSVENPMLTSCDPAWGAYTTWDTSATNNTSQSAVDQKHYHGQPSPPAAGPQVSLPPGTAPQTTVQNATAMSAACNAERREKILELPQPVPALRPVRQEEAAMKKPQVLVIQRMPKVTSTVVKATPLPPPQPWPDMKGTQITITPISPRPLGSWSSRTRTAPSMGEGAVILQRPPERRLLEDGVTATPAWEEPDGRRPPEDEMGERPQEQETMIYQGRTQQGKMYRMAYRRTRQSQQSAPQGELDFPTKEARNRARKNKKREQALTDQQQAQEQVQQLLQENEQLRNNVLGLRKRLLHFQGLYPTLRAAQEEVNSLRRITNSLRLQLFVSEKEREAIRHPTSRGNV